MKHWAQLSIHVHGRSVLERWGTLGLGEHRITTKEPQLIHWVASDPLNPLGALLIDRHCVN
jgi:hypothetical protein